MPSFLAPYDHRVELFLLFSVRTRMATRQDTQYCVGEMLELVCLLSRVARWPMTPGTGFHVLKNKYIYIYIYVIV